MKPIPEPQIRTQDDKDPIHIPIYNTHILDISRENKIKGPKGPDRGGLRLPKAINARTLHPDIFDRPPWHAISSLELAAALGISLQTVANWRIRGVGPSALPKGLYPGNRSYYLAETVLTWLSSRFGETRSGWLYSRDYLAAVFPTLSEETEPTVREFITTLEAHDVFTHQWRRTRKRDR